MLCMCSRCRTGTNRIRIRAAAFRFRLSSSRRTDRAGASGRARWRAHAGAASRNAALGRPADFAIFRNILTPGDCLVLNDSRVLPSRLFGQREDGEAEVMLLEPVIAGCARMAGARPARAASCASARRAFRRTLFRRNLAQGERGERTVRSLGDDDVYAAIERLGHMPLPPYIKRQDRVEDRERYQTVFARERGSVAAPTAGLHFTRRHAGSLRAGRSSRRARHSACRAWNLSADGSRRFRESPAALRTVFDR